MRRRRFEDPDGKPGYLMGMTHFILDEQRQPIPCPDHIACMAWQMEQIEKRIVAQEQVGPVFVSTIFFGITGWYSGPCPDPFETRLETKEDGWSQSMTWDTWEHAALGHDLFVEATKVVLLRRQGNSTEIPELLQQIRAGLIEVNVSAIGAEQEDAGSPPAAFPLE